MFSNLWVMIFTFLMAIVGDAMAVRDAEAEEKCQAFLLSPVASPLKENLNRNLRIDEDAEFFCELVLQDVDLPAQIRVTVHEGLSYLATRHVQVVAHDTCHDFSYSNAYRWVCRDNLTYTDMPRSLLKY